MDEGRLLRDVLRLWVATRLYSKYRRICSEETLGMMPQIEDPEAATFGQIPIPPVMDAQIEVITTTNLLQPLSKAVLNQLQTIMLANKLSSWFTVYLCNFILLHNCALLLSANIRRAREHGIPVNTLNFQFICH